MRTRWRAEIRSNIMVKNTRAPANVGILRTKCSTDQKLPKDPSRCFLPTSSPAPRNYYSASRNNLLREARYFVLNSSCRAATEL
eukprot:5621414-Pyramimonas_sp.AAC.1